MSYPFPGMNPYLERTSLWPDVHIGLIRGIQSTLAQIVAPRYYVSAEDRTYIAALDPGSFVGRPDVAVIEPATPVLAGVAIAPVNGHAVSVFVPVSDEVRERYLEIRERGTNRVITVIEILVLLDLMWLTLVNFKLIGRIRAVVTTIIWPIAITAY